MKTPDVPWSVPVRLVEVGRGFDRTLAPDEATLKRIAAGLDLAALNSFIAKVKVSPWLDGAEVEGRWKAELAYTCGLTLDPFDSALEGEFRLRLLPADSPNAPAEEPEAVIDLEGEDPPDLLETDVIDLGVYLVEHLALELDPFPRKPGAAFEPPPEPEVPSPFAVLAQLRPKDKT